MKKDFSKMFVPGALKVPAKLSAKGMLKAPKTFHGPKELILSGYCTPAENQGAKPWCAAYSASSYAENLRWRSRGFHTDIDPEPIYRHAKSIDGDPDGDGTYLECALDGLLAAGYFDSVISKVKTLRTLDDVKYAIHRYGVCVAGFDITDEWFAPKRAVVTGARSPSQGGHAVTLCGYDEGGVLVLNSWGREYGKDGFVYVTNKAFGDQFIYGALLTNTL